MCFSDFWQDLTSAPVTCHFRSIYCTTLYVLQFLQDLGESPTITNRFSFHNIHMIWLGCHSKPGFCWFATLCQFNLLHCLTQTVASLFDNHYEALAWGILDMGSWTHQELATNMWLGALGKRKEIPNRNLKIEQNCWNNLGLMDTCLWNLNSKSYEQLLTGTP